MKIYTGNFANIKKYREMNLFPISIALSAMYYSGSWYRKLNPDRSFLNDNQDVYTPKYEKKLSSLDAQDVYNEIEALSGGQDVVLLCHEKEGDFCHRSLVAKWLKEKLQIEVKELGNPSVKKTKDSLLF